MNIDEKELLGNALFEESQDALFLFDPETDQLLDANTMALRLTSLSREDLLQMETTQLFRMEGQEDWDRLRNAVNKTGLFHSQEGFALRTRDDEVWIPVNLTIARIHLKSRTLGLISARDIREQREAHLQLKKMEAELRRVMASVSDCLWSAVIDEKGRWSYRFFSPVVEKITGHPPEYFLSGPKRWLGIIHPEDRPLWENIYGKLKANRLSQEEYRIVMPDRAVRWIRDSVRVTREEEGRSYRMDGLVTDITDYKQAQAALQYEGYLLNSLMDNVPDTIYFKDAQSRFVRINKTLAQRFQLRDPNLALGKSDFDFFQSDHAKESLIDEKNVMQSGKPLVDKEEKEEWTDGRETWALTTKMPLRDKDGKVIGTFGISRDITEQKVSEKALSESERRYRQVTEASLDAIIVVHQGGEIILFNPAAEKIFGYQAAEILGKDVQLLIPEHLREPEKEGFESFVNTRVPKIMGQTVEFFGLRKDGTEFPLELSLSAIDLGGELQFLGAVRDLTERNRMRAMVVQSEKLASIGLLSAGMAHEINNPLSYVANNLVVLERDIQGLMAMLAHYEKAKVALRNADAEAVRAVEALEEKIDLPYIRENLDRVLGRTRDGVQRVSKIVQSLRGLARTDRPNMEEAYLPDLVDASLEMIRSRLQKRGIRIDLDYDSPPKILCVSTQISQVLLNLLINALQAIESTPRTEGCFIRVGMRQEGNDLVVAVVDNGCGIDPHEFPRIFDPFYTTKPVGEGTGLGLSISHGIITGHGGRIEVESQVGEGTEFRLFLPLRPT